MNKAISSVALIGAVAIGCAQSDETTGDVVSLETGGLDVRDEGTSYNGWTQSSTGKVTQYWNINNPSEYLYANLTNIGGTFTRTSGDNTRGGGSCFVEHRKNSTFTDDTSCTTAAQAYWGSQAYGYCYQGTCWARPGSQSAFCTVNPNRSTGTFTAYPGTNVFWNSAHDSFGTLGCMTKTAGPNFACGGTDTSLYMRTRQGCQLVNEYIEYF